MRYTPELEPHSWRKPGRLRCQHGQDPDAGETGDCEEAIWGVDRDGVQLCREHYLSRCAHDRHTFVRLASQEIDR